MLFINHQDTGEDLRGYVVIFFYEVTHDKWSLMTFGHFNTLVLVHLKKNILKSFNYSFRNVTRGKYVKHVRDHTTC